MLSAVAAPPTVALEEIAELDPVKLLNASGMRREDFADLMGVTKDAVDKWCYGRYQPSVMARRLAAEIEKNWKVTGRI